MANNKIKFLKIRAKNFRSIGNVWKELDYTATKSTLIVSEDNGAGKSTLSVWALYYALFGKPYAKGVKMASLTNSKSNKDCLIELDFEARGSVWQVRRGIKPNIFEIHQDGKLLENEASLKDPQDYLQSVLGFDAKSFCTMVALGVDLFVPFVQMSAGDRRSFVEQMLDLVVISDMNTKTKDRIKVIRKQSDQVTYETGILESKLANQVRTLAILETKKKQRLEESGSELEGFEQEEIKLRKMIAMADTKLEDLRSKIIPDADKKLSDVNTMIRRFKDKISDINKASEKIVHLDDCPTCKQGVTSDHKDGIQSAADKEKEALVAPLAKLESDVEKHQAVVNENSKTQEGILNINNTKIQLDAKLSSALANIKTIKTKMIDSGEDGLIEKEQESIGVIKLEIEEKDKDAEKYKAAETRHNQLLQILKDDGIKANIVQQYLPFLNQSINATLDKLNLYVQINIDPEFNVSMFSPDRKGQTIENLSTGQLRRVDLAVLLAWREIAKSKASVDCNVLILDEILENLSAAGVEDFMEMWSTEGTDMNLFVITQRNAEFDQYFERTLKYKLVNDMTVEVGV